MADPVASLVGRWWVEALGLLLRACTKATWLDGGFILRVTFSPPAG